MANPRVSRRVLTAFLAIIGITFAELSWWLTFNVRGVASKRELSLRQSEHEAQLATTLLAEVVAPKDRQAFLRLYFPSYVLRPVMAEAQAQSRLDFEVVAKNDELQKVHDRFGANIRMFMAEGSFFAAMMLVGVALIWRTMQREVGVISQQADFLAAVTHELKSPLASIRLFVETMQMRQLDLTTQKRYLDIIQSDIDRLDRLVGNILTASQLQAASDVENLEVDAKGTTSSQKIVDVAQTTGAIVQEMGDYARSRDIQLVFRAPIAQVTLAVPADAWHTIVRNLIDNAGKYARGTGEVSVRLGLRDAKRPQKKHRATDTLVLEVADHGEGLASQERERIFEQFYRVGNEMVRKSEGSGLGLFLVREILAQYGGRIEAKSDGVGLGTTFVVSVPASASVT